MTFIIKFAHIIKQRLEPGLIFTLYSLKYEAFCGGHFTLSQLTLHRITNKQFYHSIVPPTFSSMLTMGFLTSTSSKLMEILHPFLS